MWEKEAAYAKQGAMIVKNWDTFQNLLRRGLKTWVERPETKSGPEGRIACSVLKALPIIFMLSMFAWLPAAHAMTRTLQHEPAIVIAAFGTTTKASATYDFFAEQLQKELPARWHKAKIVWAFTSSIVRERVNKKFQAQGSTKRYRSLAQVLADLQDAGYRRIAIQPLHIFPGQEYEEVQEVVQAFRSLGLHIECGGTLLHKWAWVDEAVDSLKDDFLTPEQGCNVLVAHGTPETFPGSNSTYLGLDRYVSHKFKNVVVGTVEGILNREQTMDKVRTCKPGHVRMVPFLYVAGDHVMHDIMGKKASEDGTPSWAMEMQAAGLKVDSVTTTYKGKQYFKGLGFYPAINRMFIRQLVSSLKKLEVD